VVGAITTILVLVGAATVLEASGAAVVTALSTLAALGRFEQKWRIARLSRSQLDQLLIDVERPDVDLNALRETLKGTISRQDAVVLGPDDGE
jgi:hypothetical protein